jgi:hypothetical protein
VIEVCDIKKGLLKLDSNEEEPQHFGVCAWRDNCEAIWMARPM